MYVSKIYGENTRSSGLFVWWNNSDPYNRNRVKELKWHANVCSTPSLHQVDVEARCVPETHVETLNDKKKGKGKIYPRATVFRQICFHSFSSQISGLKFSILQIG